MIKMFKKVRNVLRKLFGEGKEKVREQQVLKLYQRALLNANQLLARAKAEEEASFLEEAYGAPMGAEGNVEHAIQGDPLDILPPEMWAATLDHLKDWNDLKSCYETCGLFRDLLDGSKNEWLFKGVFPLIQWRLGTEELLKCREICKVWKEQVDFVNYFPPLCHPVNIEVSRDGRARTRREVDEMVIHGKSPFVGHIVDIAVLRSGDDGDLVEDLVEDQMDQERVAAVEDINYFLHGLGKHITGILFNVSSHLSIASDLCHLVLCILSKCPGLKMMRISGMHMMDFEELDYLTEHEMDELTPQDFRLGPNFQSLAVDTLCGFSPIQNRILQLCGGQLKKLEIEELDYRTFNFEMGALEELEIKRNYDFFEEAYYEYVPEELMQLRAPRLKKLELPVNTSFCSLEDLLVLTNQFPNIQHLNLNWSDDFRGFTKEELLAVPEGLEPPPSLKTLQFRIFQFNDKMNADFLMFFPLLETLRLSHDFQDDNTDKGFIVQLSYHWLQEPYPGIYESNVWELLPFLKMVMVSSQDFYTFNDYDTWYDTVYSRKKYNALKSKFKQTIETSTEPRRY